MLFEELGLQAELLSAVKAQGYTTPTPIQAGAIPAVLQKRDVLAGAQTGTGKTAAFVLPMLQILSRPGQRGRKPRALVLTPTRELAAQVGESVNTYGKNMRLKSTIVFGGVGFQPQIDAMRRGVDILVATPGRLLDLAGRGVVNLSQIEILILDEADRMLDMGFIHDIRRVIDLMPEKRQNMLFSATYSNDIRRLADGLLDNPECIEVAARNAPIELVEQVVHPVARKRKREMLSKLIREGDWRQVLVFTRTKHGANRLAKQLTSDGVTASAIHGNKSQSARTRALADFKSGGVRILVATDIASRGLDIDQLPHVVNFELPNVPEDYIHRIGRTGRAGKNGVALSMVCADEKKLLFSIERLLRRDIPVENIDGFAADAAAEAPEPIPELTQNRGQRPRRGGSSRPQQRGGNGGGGRGRRPSSRPRSR